MRFVPGHVLFASSVCIQNKTHLPTHKSQNRLGSLCCHLNTVFSSPVIWIFWANFSSSDSLYRFDFIIIIKMQLTLYGQNIKYLRKSYGSILKSSLQWLEGTRSRGFPASSTHCRAHITVISRLKQPN